MVLKRKFAWSCYNGIFLFATHLSHLHPLQVENCDSNLLLVVDENDNGKFRLERVKRKRNIVYFLSDGNFICYIFCRIINVVTSIILKPLFTSCLNTLLQTDHGDYKFSPQNIF